MARDKEITSAWTYLHAAAMQDIPNFIIIKWYEDDMLSFFRSSKYSLDVNIGPTGKDKKKRS